MGVVGALSPTRTDLEVSCVRGTDDMQLDLNAIAEALVEKPRIRARIAADYGLSPDDLSTAAKLLEAIPPLLNQLPIAAPLEQSASPQRVFECAVNALGSNSRNWQTYTRGRPQLRELLSGYDPRMVCRALDDGKLTEAALWPLFPGTTGKVDVSAVIRWAERLQAGDFMDELRSVAFGLRRQHESLFGESMDEAHLMPALAVTLAHPSKRWLAGLREAVPELPTRPSTLKTAGMGPTLASEFLRNLGFSGFKPDRHVIRLLGDWAPEVVLSSEGAARKLAATTGRQDRGTVGFLRYSLAGQWLTPQGTEFSVADNLVWTLGHYVETKRKRTARIYVT